MQHRRAEGSRVVITGVGVVSGLGEDAESFWSGLANGRSCIGLWSGKDPRIATKVGGQLDGFSLDDHLARAGDRYPAARVASLRRVLRSTPFAPRVTACASLQAFVDAHAADGNAPERFAHVCAGQNLTMGYFAENLRAFAEHPDDIEPLLGMMALDTDTVAVVSELLDLRGPSAMVGGACASGNIALIAGLDLVRSGRADAVLVSGAPFSFESMFLHSSAIIEAVTFRSFNDSPARASRPFDALREGFVPSEGAAAVVIESLANARRRGARPYAELLGGASASDACRLPKPHVEGQVRAIRAALADAEVDADRVDYVNAHATSTPLGDAVEVAALKAVLGPRARQIPVNATKSMIGHGVTSAALLELVATVLQMKHGVVHPTINQEHADPELDLDFVPNVAREHDIHTAISNSFGFGGINSCVVVGQIQ